MYCHPPNIEKGTRGWDEGIKISYIHHMVKKNFWSLSNLWYRAPIFPAKEYIHKIFSLLCEFCFVVCFHAWLESLTSSRFPIGFCYQKTCDNKWWFSVLLFCFQTASNFVTVPFFSSHLQVFSQRAKNWFPTFFLFVASFQFQPFERIDFLISLSLFPYWAKNPVFLGMIFPGIHWPKIKKEMGLYKKCL